MATGDFQGNLDRLRVQLRTIGYPHALDLQGLKDGNPAAILPLLHYALLSYSRHVSRHLSENGYELFAKNDLRFVECTLKFLREEFGYRCPLTVAQIFSRGFAERKFLFVHDVIQVCKRKHSELLKLARQAHPFRKIKGDIALNEAAKGVDVVNINSVHMPVQNENMLQALQKAVNDQERASKTNNRIGNKLEPSRTSVEFELQPQKPLSKEPSPENRHCEGTLHQNKLDHLGGNERCQRSGKEEGSGLENLNSTAPHCIELIRPSRYDPSSRQEEHFKTVSLMSKQSINPSSFGERPKSADSHYKVNQALNQCYEDLRQQIVDVANILDRRLITLEGDVRRMTANMQAKMVFLERQAHYLEQMLPLQRAVGRRAAAIPENFYQYEKNFSLRRSDENIQNLQIPVTHTIRDISNIHQNIAKSVSGGIMNLDIPMSIRGNFLQNQQRLSTQELIASVKARCNKTKELLIDGGWTAPT